MKYRHIAAWLVIAAALGGCSDDDPDAATGDPVTASAAPSPSGDPSAEESESFDPAKETARQFIKRWQAVSAKMQVTGDTGAYRTLYDETCASCDRLVEDIESIYEAGGYVKVEPSQIVGLERDTRNQWTVRFSSEGRSCAAEKANRWNASRVASSLSPSTSIVTSSVLGA